ncbi:hypothetical protein GCM10007977_089010 [Dactylosporangium sucinum]|uniref:Uncharacterized protein n=1 Tax=Dactylosporangium sucinum TaxID=1424081 RepID=A0A917X4P5_9ACTN|nr:hypothetical protein GCM10007977_089010 [Dactylosporangium sucinum]
MEVAQRALVQHDGVGAAVGELTDEPVQLPVADDRPAGHGVVERHDEQAGRVAAMQVLEADPPREGVVNCHAPDRRRGPG